MVLQCTFKGWPRPLVAWYNPDSKRIINGSDSFYLYEQLVGEDTLSSVLQNLYIQEKHAGAYKCIGMNNITGWSSENTGVIEIRYRCKSDCPARYEKPLNKTTLKKWTNCPRSAVTQSPRKGIKQKVEHGIPCYIKDSKKAVDLHRSKGLCNN
ncbi:unnamed protein product, partial [Porites lobata]